MPLAKEINQKFEPKIGKANFGIEQQVGDLEHTIEDGRAYEQTPSIKAEPVAGQTTQAKDDSGIGEPGVDTTKSSLHQNIESILEEDLEEIYFSMDKDTQKKFKIEGEKTTQEIILLVKNAKETFKKIFKLIFGWLKIIPSVNKFFLEQEAKIKADKILKINK
ncbi:MAG: hypothetical protein ABIF17_02610 [Patescibacteria group bacterium]